VSKDRGVALPVPTLFVYADVTQNHGRFEREMGQDARSSKLVTNVAAKLGSQRVSPWSDCKTIKSNQTFSSDS